MVVVCSKLHLQPPLKSRERLTRAPRREQGWSFYACAPLLRVTFIVFIFYAELLPSKTWLHVTWVQLKHTPRLYLQTLVFDRIPRWINAMAKAAAKKKSVSVQSQTASPPKADAYSYTPLYNLLCGFRRAQDQWVARYVTILSAVVLWSAVGLGLFSGKGQKPINGDFEAQRHWMEITTLLPVTKWYLYDLQYWGLDYPPLTAYHLWFFGIVGKFIDPSWFALDTSRGLETPQIKTFMRLSSILSELVVFVPAVMGLLHLLGAQKQNLTRMNHIMVIALILYLPALVLIDHGHFQYNSVMLGLFLISVTDLIKGNLMLASVWFISAILFKQMALYYSPFIFVYILSCLFTPKKTLAATLKSFNFGKLIAVGLTVIIATVVIILPFLFAASSASEAVALIKQILIRMFPFERGLFEDKVANFWCTTNLVVKYSQRFSHEQLKLLSLIFTVAAFTPPCLMIFWKNVRRQSRKADLVIFGFSATAWAFYLFLFQVHEKTVLVPLIPTLFLLLNTDRCTIAQVQWINNISIFSLFPLLKKDGLLLQYYVMFVMINWMMGGLTLSSKSNMLWPSSTNLLNKLVIFVSYAAIPIFHIVEYNVMPPARYPDLWVIANTSISFCCFSWFYLWLMYKIYTL